MDKSPQRSALISDEYLTQQNALHKRGGYGSMGAFYGPLVAAVINKLEVTHLLDYGCGSQLSLAQGLKGKVNHAFTYQAYDPCVPEYASPPVPAELVVCCDVLEHIEEDRIDAVLDHLEELTEAVGIFTVSTGPAKKVLPDGRNAHILQRPPEWWLPRFMARFDLQTFQVTGEHAFYVVVHALPRSIEDTDGKKLT